LFNHGHTFGRILLKGLGGFKRCSKRFVSDSGGKGCITRVVDRTFAAEIICWLADRCRHGTFGDSAFMLLGCWSNSISAEPLCNDSHQLAE
jgi:hypothetical protein